MCQLVGPLPPEWGNNSAWSNLTVLDLSYNPTIGGGVPDEWGGNTSFRSLTVLNLRSTGLVGGLPLGWGVPSSFPTLSSLDMSDNALEGFALVFDAMLDIMYSSELLWRAGLPRLRGIHL